MSKNLWVCLLPLLLIFSTPTNAQHRNCSAMDHMHANDQVNPQYEQIRQQIEEHTRNFAQSDINTRVTGIITIPPVVHIVYHNNPENISLAQIQSQLDVLNDDFRRMNADASNTPVWYYKNIY